MTNNTDVPGAWLRRFAERTFDPETLDRVLLPAIADLQHECGDGSASWISRVRAYWGLWKTIALCVLRDAASAARPTVASVTTRTAVIFPIVMAAAMIAAFDSAVERALTPVQFVLAMTPQMIAIALPVAYFFAVVLEPASNPRRLLPAIFATSVVCTLLMLTLSTLVDVGIASGTLGTRIAYSTVPLMLGLVALAICGYTWPIALLHGMWVLMFYVAALRAAGPSSSQGPAAARIWLVNGAFALGGFLVVLLRQRANGVEPPKRFYMRA
jgi:hypothetical protein